MNKQEVLKKLEQKKETILRSQKNLLMESELWGLYEARATTFMSAINIVEQLDEPKKVKARLAKHWDEDLGDCLWWDFPVEEPPYCGTPLDDDFPKYKTHFTELHIPDEVEQEPKWIVKDTRNSGMYFKGVAGISVDGQFSNSWSQREGCIKFSDKEKAEAVATLTGGTVEKV